MRGRPVALGFLVTAGLALAGCAGDAGEEQGDPPIDEAATESPATVELVGEPAPGSPLADVELLPSPSVGPAYPNVRIGLSTPGDDAQFDAGEPVEVEFALSGYELGIPTPGGDERGIARSPDGQHIHFVVDDGPYQAHYDAGEPIVLEDLSAGTHVLRAFPGRDWHESVKTPGALVQRLIVVGDDPAAYPPVEEWGPHLIYSRPQGSYEGAAADSVMVDFVVGNAQLSDDGYRVQVTVDGERQFLVNEWAPYLLVGLPDGDHTLRLELVDADGVTLEAPFHPVEREFSIQR